MRRGGNRDRVHQVEKRPEGAVFVVGAIHEKADEALHARADEESVNVRHVIADEQCTAFFWNLVSAHQPDAVDAVGNKPKHKA